MSRTVPARGALVAWACLTVAIVAEVVGTSFMAHAARDGGWTGYLVMAGALALSYFFLAQSVRRIAVGALTRPHWPTAGTFARKASRR